MLSATGPIGVFDSGYGGLTILDKIRELLPQYDYIYLGTMPVPHTEQDRSKLFMSLHCKLYASCSI